jgi:hypothetical protein
MQTTHPPAAPPIPSSQFKAPKNFPRSTRAVEHGSSRHAIDEINAYIAIRDDLLAEAEELPTCAKLDSVAVANDFVETCLRSPRPSYKAQHLPEADAIRERKRCEEVKQRISELRSRVSAGY